MTESIHIGETNTTPMVRPTRPMRSLPANLDCATCLKILAQIDPDAKTDSVAAAASSIDVGKLDDALEYTELSLSDRFRLKHALGQFGIISDGRPVGRRL